MTLEEQYREYIINQMRYKRNNSSTENIAKYTININSLFKVSSKLYSPKQEQEDLKNLQANYIYSGNELEEILLGFKEITTTEIKSLQEKLEKTIEQKLDNEKETLLKSFENLKEELKSKTVETILSDKDFSEIPEQLKNDFKDILKKQGKSLIDATNEELEDFFKASISKYTFFINNYIKELKKYTKKIITSNTYKMIATLSSDINSEENRKKIDILIFNMKIIEKIDKENSEIKKQNLMRKLKSVNGEKTPSETYLETINSKEYFLSTFHTLESFKDISKAITKKNRIKNLANPAKRVKAATEIIADIAAKTIGDIIISSKTGLETSSTYVFDKITNENEKIEDRIDRRMFDINEKGLDEKIAIATFVEETRDKITQRSLKITRNENYIHLFEKLKTNSKILIKKLINFIPSLETEIEEVKEEIEERKTIYEELLKKSGEEFDFSKRFYNRFNEEVGNVEEIEKEIENNVNKYIEKLEQTERKIRIEAKIIKNQISDIRNTATENIIRMEENIEILKRAYEESKELNLSESDKEEIKIKIEELSKSIITITNNINKLNEDIQNIEIEARTNIKRITEIAEEIQENYEEFKEKTSTSYEKINNLLNKYKEEIEDIINLNFEELKSRYFTETEKLLKQVNKDLETIKKFPQVMLNKTQKLIGYEQYKKIVKSLKGMKKISTKLKEEEKVKNYFLTIQNLTIDYGYHENYEDYEVELYKVSELKIEAYKKINEINNDSTKGLDNEIEVNEIINNLAKDLLIKFPNKEIKEIYEEILTEIKENEYLKLYSCKEKKYLQTLDTKSSEKYINLINKNAEKEKKPILIKSISFNRYKKKEEEDNIFKKTISKIFNRKDNFLNINPLKKDKQNKKINFELKLHVLLKELESYRSGLQYEGKDAYGIKNIAKATTLIFDTMQKEKETTNEAITELKNKLNQKEEEKTITIKEKKILDVLKSNKEITIQTKKILFKTIKESYDFIGEDGIEPEITTLYYSINTDIEQQEIFIKKIITLIKNNVKEFKENKKAIKYGIEKNKDKFIPKYIYIINEIDIMINEHLSMFNQLKRLNGIDEDNKIQNELINDIEETDINKILENMIYRRPMKITNEEIISSLEKGKREEIKAIPGLSEEEKISVIETKLLASNETYDYILQEKEDLNIDIYANQIYLEETLNNIVLDTKRSKLDKELREHYMSDIEEITTAMYKSIYKFDVVAINKEVWRNTEKILNENKKIKDYIYSNQNHITLYLKKGDMELPENFSNEEKQLIKEVIIGMKIQSHLSNLEIENASEYYIEDSQNKLKEIAQNYNPKISKSLNDFLSLESKFLKENNGLQNFHKMIEESDSTSHYDFRNSFINTIFNYREDEEMLKKVFKLFKEKITEENKHEHLLGIEPKTSKIIEEIRKQSNPISNNRNGQFSFNR